MITEKQAEARRNNGKLSHGPVTAEGKARSAGHALKFGFFSQSAVLPGEDPAAFDTFRGELLESFAPVGPYEKMLADKIVSLAWRLRRVAAIEACVIESHIWAIVAQDAYKEADRLVLWNAPPMVEVSDPEAFQAAHDLQAEADRKCASPDLALGRAFIRDAAGPNTLVKITRNEGVLDRVLCRSLTELQRLQAKRKLEPTEGLKAFARAA